MQAVSQYAIFYIESDPRVLVDQILLSLRAMLGSNKLDWKRLRNEVRDEWGAIVKQLAVQLSTPLSKLWGAVVTYQEGLLCSSCIPKFSPTYLNVQTNTIALKPDVADDVAKAVIDLFNAWDGWFAVVNNRNHVTNAVMHTCVIVVKNGAVACRPLVPTAVSFVIKALTLNELKILLCGMPAKPGDEETQCKNMVVNNVLHGLAIDGQPVVGNVFDKIAQMCKMLPTDCSSEIVTAKAQVLMLFDTFDDRPVLNNVYSDSGYDARSAACLSHLSGYACGGQGWPPYDHSQVTPSDSGDGGLSAAGAVLIALLLVGIAGVLVTAAVHRHRIRNAAVNAYQRMRDGGAEGSSGPLVGLV